MQVKARLEPVKFLICHRPLTNFETQNYYQNEPKFNGVYLRNNLLKKSIGYMY